MKKLLAIIVLGLLWSHSVLAEPKKRSEKEIKMGVFLEDLKIIGKYKKIEEFPVGLFDSKYKSFAARSNFSQSEVARIFVKQKGLLTKYPERMMLGMAYFEFFYQQQLKDNKRSINNFIENYPTWDTANIASIQKIYSLNEARRTMREALGLKIDDESKKVLNTFYTMSMLFEGAEIKTVKLSKEEKKKINIFKRGVLLPGALNLATRIHI